MPEDKIAIVQQYQDQGRIVVMIGDCVNDAPALMQTDVGIAMDAVGSDMAIEAAHTTLMRENWNLVPTLLCIAPRRMFVVKMNLGFTLLYNLTGITLATFGLLTQFSPRRPNRFLTSVFSPIPLACPTKNKTPPCADAQRADEMGLE